MAHLPVHAGTPNVEAALADKMSSLALKEKEQETEARANDLQLGYINLVGFPIGPETISLIARKTAGDFRVVCFLRTASQIRLASTDPLRPEVQSIAQELATKHRANVELYVVSEHSLDTALRLYDHLPKIIDTTPGFHLTSEAIERYRKEITDFRDLDQAIQKASVTDAFTLILAGALQANSSDIHIEAEAEDVRVRFRVDGVLTDVARLPHSTWPRIISRIKLLAGLKLNITTAPQDGRISIILPDDNIDVRVSALPTAFGESVVMRLLRESGGSITFEELGLRDRAQEKLSEQITHTNGMIIITGPTGSGKTTTLYAILNKLNQPDTKIITLEDPIEYKIPGINQSQVDWSKEYTFAKGLRSVLRQDPDIVMVGEIRDLETAETAIQAGLTGHLVLSTVHTNDAAGAIPRFLAMGAKPFLLAPAINAVVAQRLVRRLCPYCQGPAELDAATQEKVKTALAAIPGNSGYSVPADRPLNFKKGLGCDRCHGLGYQGRIGVFEVLSIDADIEKIILSGQVSEYGMRDVAQKQGMVTMVQDGLLKALDGMTSVEEVFRVTDV